MKLSFGCTDWRCSGRARLTESLTAGSFQRRIMGAVFLFRRHKLLTTGILILITLPRTADLASLYNLDKLSTHVLYFLKHLLHLSSWSLKMFSPIPNFAKCCSCEMNMWDERVENNPGVLGWKGQRKLPGWLQSVNYEVVLHLELWWLSVVWSSCTFPSDLFTVAIPKHNDTAIVLFNEHADTRGHSDRVECCTELLPLLLTNSKDS